jgi:PqqD family protein of HPr-rel-A system
VTLLGKEQTIGNSKQLWHVNRSAGLAWKCWNGDYVVFNGTTGETHFLDVVAGDVFRNLTEGPRELTELHLGAGRFLKVEIDDKLMGMVAELIGRLHKLGLIEPAH